ncbi:MAG: hypothetical protein FIA99_17125 [Ruminiclostridium sp.]|nr:hypothetical protein [Ruminiclostridium sp.]
MKIFDCYCTFGRPPIPPFRYAETAVELIQEMEYCGIDEAVVYHTAQKDYTPLEGNRIVVEETMNYPTLHPAWAILPEQTGEQPNPGKFIKLMKENNVKVLYAFPGDHAYLLDRLGFGSLLDTLIEHSIPLFMKVNWDLMRSVLGEFPNLTLVGVGSGPHGQDRLFRPLLERYPGFYLDTSTYLQDGGIEDICKCYGAKRLLFGTGYPRNCSGSSLLRIMTAEISEEERALICHGNIERLLQEVKL